MKTKDEEKTREQLIDELAELRIEVAELQVFKSEQNRVPAALGESESHADSRFEVPPPWSRSPQRERGVRRSPEKVIKVMKVPLYSPTPLKRVGFKAPSFLTG